LKGGSHWLFEGTVLVFAETEENHEKPQSGSLVTQSQGQAQSVTLTGMVNEYLYCSLWDNLKKPNIVIST